MLYLGRIVSLPTEAKNRCPLAHQDRVQVQIKFCPQFDLHLVERHGQVQLRTGNTPDPDFEYVSHLEAHASPTPRRNGRGVCPGELLQLDEMFRVVAKLYPGIGRNRVSSVSAGLPIATTFGVDQIVELLQTGGDARAN